MPRAKRIPIAINRNGYRIAGDVLCREGSSLYGFVTAAGRCFVLIRSVLNNCAFWQSMEAEDEISEAIGAEIEARLGVS